MTDDNKMDPVATSSLIVLATQIAGLAIKYNDSNLVAPSLETVLKHLDEFKKIAPLPEEYDVGFVESIMEKVNGFIGAK